MDTNDGPSLSMHAVGWGGGRSRWHAPPGKCFQLGAQRGGGGGMSPWYYLLLLPSMLYATLKHTGSTTCKCTIVAIMLTSANQVATLLLLSLSIIKCSGKIPV